LLNQITQKAILLSSVTAQQSLNNDETAALVNTKASFVLMVKKLTTFGIYRQYHKESPSEFVSII
jgi:hypothetical protein